MPESLLREGSLVIEPRQRKKVCWLPDAHENLFRFVLSESQVVATDFYLDRIAHGSKPYKLYGGAYQEAQFHNARAHLRGEVNFRNDGRCSGDQSRKRLDCNCRHRSFSLGPPDRHLLDENGFRQFIADAQARVAYLAYVVGIPGEELDSLRFAKAHLAQTLFNCR